MISIGWTSLVKHDIPLTPKFVATAGALYGLTGIFPQRMKYLIPLWVLGKLAVLRRWIILGCPEDELRVLTLGDTAFGVVMSIAFYRLMYPQEEENK